MEEIIYTVDRIEGEFAVCISDDENDTMDIPTILIPECREGLSILVKLNEADGITEIVDINILQRESKAEESHNRLKNLFNK